MKQYDKEAVKRYRQVWFWLLLWVTFLPVTQAATNCNAVTEIPVSECQSLMELYNSTDGPNWKNHTGWNQTNTPCSWFGVSCEKGHVTEIELDDDGNYSNDVYENGLKGQIPDFNLPNLRSLDLSRNQLSGNIPDFTNLVSLKELSLNHNQLSGNVPNFSNLPNLTTLYLRGNQLSGNIPNFSNLPSLKYLEIDRLSGNIPDFSNLPNLKELSLSGQLSTGNQLNGNIPNFSKLPNLEHLSLMSNQLSGNIPNFSKLPNLEFLWLGFNQLSGSIPDFSNLPNLQYLSLDSNQLSGSIPDFSNLPNLQNLSLSFNRLNGSIPNFSNLPDLKELDLKYNKLSGSIPNFTAFSLADLKHVEFSNNCGLIAYDAAQESVLNSKDPKWQTRNSNCSVTNQPQPPITDASSGVQYVSRGSHYTCALKHDGSIVCWGGNPEDDSGVNIPPEGNEFTQITTSTGHACALKKDSSILCWGTEGKELPSGNFIQVKASPYITCSLDSEGKISCQDRYDLSSSLPEIGDKTPSTLGESPASGKYTQISVSNTSWNPHACALRDNGSIDCWGWDNYGQSSAPSGSFTQVSAGTYWTCAISTDGNIICWGKKDLKVTTMPPSGTFSQLCDPNPYCAIKSDGGIACWGEVGEKYTVPEGQFTQVSCGGSSSCAVKTDGTVICWGNDQYGEAIPPKELTKESAMMVNKFPIADYYASPTNGQAPLTVTLDASSSSDSDGSIVSYKWSVNGQTLSGKTVSITFNKAGDYPITLMVTDDKGATGTKIYTITVNQPAATLAPKIRIEPTALNFDNVQNVRTRLRSNADSPVKIHKIAGNQELFVNPSQTEESSPDPTITRVRYAEVNLNALSQLDAAFGTVYTERLILNLFPDVSFTVNNLSINYRGQDDYTWIGKIDGTQFGDVILVVKEGRVTGNVNAQGEVYRIRSLQDGWHAIQKMNPAAFPEDAPSVLPPSSTLPELLPSDETQNSQLRSTRANRENGTPIIDVMVVYTPVAAQTPTGNNVVDITSEIQLAVEETNQVYANSGIKQRLRLVHTEQVDYTESGSLETDLKKLKSSSDGYIDNVHSLRNTYKADLVSLWVGNGGTYCGLSPVMFGSSVSQDFAVHGLNVIVRKCATSPQYSYPHELGHIMGAHHAMYEAKGEPGAYPYSHGYVHGTGDNNSSWRTIMAYNTQCNEKGYSCQRIPYFSNPDITYQGIATGDASANNALTLNNTADIVASFRDSSNLLTEETKKFTIYNDGDADLAISTIALESNAPWIAVSPKTATLSPKGNITVNVKVYYTLAPSGQSTSHLLISSNDSTNSVLPVNIVVNHQIDTAAAAPADVYDGEVQSLSVTAQAGEETYQAVLNPIILQSDVIGSVFEISGYTLIESGVVDESVTTYNPQTGIVQIPIGSTYLSTGEPMLFEVEMKETSRGIFEVTDFLVIPVQAIE